MAEACVEAYGLELPVASWWVVETEDGVCRLADSAFGHGGVLSRVDVKAMETAGCKLLEKNYRPFVSDGRLRLLAQAVARLPITQSGRPVLSLLLIETAEGEVECRDECADFIPRQEPDSSGTRVIEAGQVLGGYGFASSSAGK